MVSRSRTDVRRWLAEHPRPVIAAKTAAAAGLAWLLVQAAGEVLDRSVAYPYYAPLGALVVVTYTAAGSLREAVGAVVALVLGATLALGAQVAGLPEIAALVLVVGVGTLLAGLPRLGTMGSWIPVSGLFVLLVGRADPITYSLAYVGLVAVGAAVGVAVNLAVPPLPLIRVGRIEEQVRELLAEQLETLADGLLCEDELSEEDWAARRRDLVPGLRRLDEHMGELADARRLNWRVRQWREQADRRHAQARSLRQLGLLVEDVAELVTARGHLLRERPPEDEGSLLPPTGRAIAATAALLRSVEGARADPERLREADAAADELARTIRDHHATERRDGFAAAAIVTSIRRAVASLAPVDEIDRLPSNW